MILISRFSDGLTFTEFQTGLAARAQARYLLGP
jgi:hypothetical protein